MEEQKTDKELDLLRQIAEAAKDHIPESRYKGMVAMIEMSEYLDTIMQDKYIREGMINALAVFTSSMAPHMTHPIIPGVKITDLRGCMEVMSTLYLMGYRDCERRPTDGGADSEESSSGQPVNSTDSDQAEPN